MRGVTMITYFEDAKLTEEFINKFKLSNLSWKDHVNFRATHKKESKNI
jgi:hypothetical protein